MTARRLVALAATVVLLGAWSWPSPRPDWSDRTAQEKCDYAKRWVLVRRDMPITCYDATAPDGPHAGRYIGWCNCGPDRPNEIHIWLNPRWSRWQVSWLISHEIGHLVAFKTGVPSTEDFADRFAWWVTRR